MVNVLNKRSPAKLNLFLHIIDRLETGYHEIQTIFELIDLQDELTFVKSNTNILNLTIQGLPLSKTDNLIIKAHSLIEKATEQRLGVNIILHKHIPIGAGLGGGSSNAATTLLALNELFTLNLTQADLKKLALSLGADVPVFIGGQTAWAEGIGEKLTPISLPKQYYVILVPDCSVNTVSIYQSLSSDCRTPQITYSQYDFDKTHNDLESTVLQKHPKIKKAIHWLNQFSVARLTGSGSAIFAKVTQADATKIARQENIPGKIFITQALNTKKIK